MTKKRDIESLVEGLRRHNHSCQEELYTRYSARFFALCLRYLGDRDLAADALQQGFLDVYRHVSNYRGEGPFEAWMRVIFLRKALKIIRNLDPQQCMPPEDYDRHLPAHNPEPQADLREALDLSLAHLTPTQRALFNLVAVEGYSFPEVARMTQSTLDIVKKDYYKAIARLRSELAKHGITA